MRISEAFCKMRLSEYCTSQDVDRAIAVTVDSFVGGQKVSCKKALARAFAKYVFSSPSLIPYFPLSFPPLLSSFIRFPFPIILLGQIKYKSSRKEKKKKGLTDGKTGTRSRSRARSGVRMGGTGSEVGRGLLLRPRRSWHEFFFFSRSCYTVVR